MKIRPLANRVLIRPSNPEAKTPGGIIIPDNAKEKQARGEVLAVGPGRILEDGSRLPVEIQAGAVVLYGKYAGQEIELDGESLRMVSDEDVLAVVE
jgi:chaperonin GroES